MNREKLQEMLENFINGNLTDVALWIDSMDPERSAFVAVQLYLLMPKNERAFYASWLGRNLKEEKS